MHSVHDAFRILSIRMYILCRTRHRCTYEQRITKPRTYLLPRPSLLPSPPPVHPTFSHKTRPMAPMLLTTIDSHASHRAGRQAGGDARWRIALIVKGSEEYMIFTILYTDRPYHHATHDRSFILRLRHSDTCVALRSSRSSSEGTVWRDGWRFTSDGREGEGRASSAPVNGTRLKDNPRYWCRCA